MYVYNVSSEASFSITGDGCACSCARCVAATLQTVSETDSQTTQINVWSCGRLGAKHVRGGCMDKVDVYYERFLLQLGIPISTKAWFSPG